jgi:hypothetical protein
MKRRFGTVVVALSWCAVAAPALFAGGADDRAEVRALEDLYAQAISDGPLERLAPALDAEFHGVMLTGDAVAGLEDLKTYEQKLKALIGPSGRYRVTIATSPAQILGDVAVSRGVTEDVIAVAGREYHLAGQWTAVARRRDGVWKLYRVHASTDPIGNPLVLDRLTAGRVAFGGALLVGGLIGGALIGVALARRRPPA